MHHIVTTAVVFDLLIKALRRLTYICYPDTVFSEVPQMLANAETVTGSIH